MLQDILKWKMGMAEEMQRAELERLRLEMRLAQQQARAQSKSAPSRSAPPMNPPKGGRQFDPRRELWAAANTPSGMGADFDKMRRTQALQLMLGGSGGGTSISNSPEQAAKAAMMATEEPRRSTNEGMNTPERSRGGGPGIGQMGTMTSSAPMPKRYTPGDVTVPSYYIGPGSGRETGGGIPEDGWYFLHKEEQVVPAPKTLKSMLMGSMVEAGSPEKGYQGGTPDARQSIMDLLFPVGGPTVSRSENMLGSRAEGLTPEEIDERLSRDYQIPEYPGAPDYLADPENTTIRRSKEAREQIADPDVHPQQALDSMAAERERLGLSGSKPTSRPGEQGIEGLSISESPISERRSTSFKGETLYNRPETSQRMVKNYSLDQRPGSPEEAAAREMEEMTRRLEKEQSDIQRLYDAANSHAQYAGNLLEYASKIQGTPAYENMRQMASDRLALAQEIERVASVRQKQLDTRQGAMGEQQARVAAAQIEAGGRVGAAKEAATGRQAIAGQSREEALMNNIRQLVTSYAGIEGGDPDTQAQMVQDMLTLFLSLGGLRQGMAGTE
jgi:hypothetical protein